LKACLLSTMPRRIFAPLAIAGALATGMAVADGASAGPTGSEAGGLVAGISPAQPCPRDQVYLLVRGYVATPCDSFIDARRLDPSHVRIRTLIRDGMACLVGPSQFFVVPVLLGSFPVGPVVVDVEHEIVHLAPDGSTRSEFLHEPFAIDVQPECHAPVPTSLPGVSVIRTEPAVPCSEAFTSLVLEGWFNDGCGRLLDPRTLDPGHVELTLKTAVGRDTFCTLALQPWRAVFPLGRLAAGTHAVEIHLVVIGRSASGSGLERRDYRTVFEFPVAPRCDGTPGPLPFVEAIQIGPTRPCDPDPPICAGDSIPVWVSGTFDSDCIQLAGIELLPSMIVGPLPEPPIVRVVTFVNECLGRPCSNVPVRWTISTKLPPLPARDYQLMVELAQTAGGCIDPPRIVQLDRTHVPFAVSGACAPIAPPRPCLDAGFAPPPGNFTACNAGIAPGHPAELVFEVRSSEALAGLQGAFTLQLPAAGWPPAPPLRVAKLEPIGAATGMHLGWNATPAGARFVLFAEQGAPIPALPPGVSRGAPVLRVVVEQVPGRVAPAVTFVTADDLLGSDAAGAGVPRCTPAPCVVGRAAPAAAGIASRTDYGVARICAERPCDFNADGFSDVRDLVLQMRCVLQRGPCADSARVDCDGDGAFSIADVVCCARHLLQLWPCAECLTDSSGVRDEPGIRLALGPPAPSAAGIDVPLRIASADRLGAALLALHAPLDRYEVVGLDPPPGSAWLALHEVREGRLELGLLHLPAPGGIETADLELTLHLALKPGQVPGGEVRALEGEFCGPDGAMLAVDLGATASDLGGALRVALSAARPNPFSGVTRLTLSLDHTAEVDARVYDLAGRMVAVLFRGRLAAGERALTWDGRGDDGRRARGGVYFLQVRAQGASVARKLILTGSP